MLAALAAVVDPPSLLAAARTAKARRGKATAALAVAAIKPLPAEELDKLAGALTSEDEAIALAAIRQLADSNAPNAHEPVEQVLAVGTVPAVAVAAIEALQRLKSPSSLAILSLYAGNRNIPVRVAAVKALGAIADYAVVDTLLERLGDSAPEVRAASAEVLAARKETRAEKRLFLLVSRGDLGAAGPLGVLISPNDIPRVAELHGRVDNPVLATVFGEFIKRTEVSDRLRVDVVRTLGRLPGEVATTALVEYLATVPEGDGRPSKDEAQKILEHRGAQ